MLTGYRGTEAMIAGPTLVRDPYGIPTLFDVPRSEFRWKMSLGSRFPGAKAVILVKIESIVG